ncbi:DUF1831 domain-containing protein [Bombilactobacillus thymidiniphilus]|uniref:DUF1831 domain-containing protein n=1 Tax=Bombilactobacillus thymidiniphilus TaxID=2923363 RepID=A0ABY4PE32_9LACO|nr:DUF1831 domain-containing protein [Bombilactobacillus thymidiniphilus]UQS83776.1 DUF1831 domain-containing protein [Bombilactobacillus thymidiniphilus]
MPTTVQINGDLTRYQINPEIKVYSLIDVGFTKSKQGNFNWEQPLSDYSPYDASYLLKVKVMQDLKNLKMAVTDQSGLHQINIFKLPHNETVIEQLHYALDTLLQRDILKIVE